MPRVCANVDFEPLGVALTGHHLELAALHRLAKRAEALGYSVLIVDGDSGFLRQRRSAPIHASSVLSASVLAATRRIQAGGIRLPSYWNAALLARELATLQELSRGRAFGLLGVGAGRDESHFGRRVRSPGDRVRHLEELLDSVRALLDGQTVTRRGRFVHLEDAFIRPPSARVPLVVAAAGPGTLRIAERHADAIDANVPPIARYLKPLRDSLGSARELWVWVFARPVLELEAALAAYRRHCPWFAKQPGAAEPEALLWGEPARAQDRLAALRAQVVDLPVIDLAGLDERAALEALEALAPAPLEGIS